MEEYAKKMLSQKKLTDQEISLLRNTFKGNDDLLKIFRKVFWPEYDWEAPLGQAKAGMWVGLDQLMQMTSQDREVVILTQIRVNNAIENGLMTLALFANSPEEKTEAEREETRKKDSTK